MIPKIELSYSPKVKLSLLPRIVCSQDAYLAFLQSWDKATLEFVEEFKVMLLSRANQILGICTLGKGSSTGVYVDVRNIFACALISNACNIITCHNHPSGSLKPSRADEEMARKLKEAGLYLDVQVIDQIIITCDGYYSFGDEGIL